MPSWSSKRTAWASSLFQIVQASLASMSFRSKYTWPEAARMIRDTSPSTLTRPRPPTSFSIRRVSSRTVCTRAPASLSPPGSRLGKSSSFGAVMPRILCRGLAKLLALRRALAGTRRRREPGDAGAGPGLGVGGGQQDPVAPFEERHALVLAAHLRAVVQLQLDSPSGAHDAHAVGEEAPLHVAFQVEPLDVHVGQDPVLDATELAQPVRARRR